MGLGALLTSSMFLFMFSLIIGFHKVEEGHIGLYYVGGKLDPKYTEPGFNWMLPILSRFENVQVTVMDYLQPQIDSNRRGEKHPMWNVWWNPDLFREDRSRQSPEEGASHRNCTKLHHSIRFNLDLRQDSP